MASAADLQALDAECPWLREDFQSGLATLRDSTAETARRLAADARVLTALAAQVPRCPFDDRGATPWTSFRREVAVARSISDVAAAAEIRAAVRLTTCLSETLRLLDEGRTTAPRALAFVREVEVYDDDLAARLDAQLAERVAGLPTWRIVQEVRRAAAVLDAEAAALRTAAKDAARDVVLLPGADDQATVVLTGPAVPLVRWFDGLDKQARAVKQAGEARTLAQLRFDLATGDEAVGQRRSHVAPASADCRVRRPVQASITVPVETALGLSHEPAWLDGYGWLSAPAARLLLVDAELRRVCVQSTTGQVVDVAERDVRPPPSPAGVREALTRMVLGEVVVHDVAWRTEDQHDPSPPLRDLVALRDRFCDGPTGTRRTAARCDLDHEIAYPDGPTAAWNLVARARRTHQLKHRGWTPLRTPTSTVWFSPAGQVVEVPHLQVASPRVDDDAVLPDAEVLAALDAAQLQALDDTAPTRPWLPRSEREEPVPDWLDPAPF